MALIPGNPDMEIFEKLEKMEMEVIELNSKIEKIAKDIQALSSKLEIVNYIMTERTLYD